MRYILILLLLSGCAYDYDRPLATDYDKTKVTECIEYWKGQAILDEYGRYLQCTNIKIK